jgi:RimJ/RimL family protein N-acetyltransferase
MIFETNRLLVRKLRIADFKAFHEMQSNLKVMQYVRGTAMTFEENKEELPKLIDFYSNPENDFWIYAIERKEDATFVGTVALVKDDEHNDEIGYRFLEKYWENGYGFEIVGGLIDYCKKIGLPSIIACVAIKNKASIKIIEKLGFKFIKNFTSDDLKIPERKYILEL